MSFLSLRLPNSLHKKVKELAKEDNISIYQFINLALSEKVSALLTEEYLGARAKRSDKDKFLKALSKVPDHEPEVHDKL